MYKMYLADSYRDVDLPDPGRLEFGLLETERPDTGLCVELMDDACDEDRDRSELCSSDWNLTVRALPEPARLFPFAVLLARFVPADIFILAIEH